MRRFYYKMRQLLEAFTLQTFLLLTLESIKSHSSSFIIVKKYSKSYFYLTYLAFTYLLSPEQKGFDTKVTVYNETNVTIFEILFKVM